MWPWPRAWFMLGDEPVQVHSSSVVDRVADGPGAVADRESNIVVACDDGGLRLDMVQLPGGKPMPSRQLAVSGRITPGLRLPPRAPIAALTPMIRLIGPEPD